MSILRRIPFANETTHKGQWEKKNIKGAELSKKTLGIVGFGNVGVRLSNLVKGFDMNIFVYDPFVDKKIIDSLGGKKIDNFQNTIQEMDYNSLHMPLTDKTKNLINII